MVLLCFSSFDVFTKHRRACPNAVSDSLGLGWAPPFASLTVSVTLKLLVQGPHFEYQGIRGCSDICRNIFGCHVTGNTPGYTLWWGAGTLNFLQCAGEFYIMKNYPTQDTNSSPFKGGSRAHRPDRMQS